MSGTIDYGNLMHTAMRRLIRDVLGDVAAYGLPGTHHFFITFDTEYPGVLIADWLKKRYPGEMTIVMQHWFENLEVGEDGFSVTLNFGDQPEVLYIPYHAIVTFVDPSVEFGLRFETQESRDEKGAGDGAPVIGQAQAEEARGKAEVVNLDSFRK